MRCAAATWPKRSACSTSCGSILENLQIAQPNNRMTDPLGREMNQAMQDLEGMTRDQQQLRDETFRDGQNKRMQQGQRGQQQQGRGASASRVSAASRASRVSRAAGRPG